MQMTNAYQDWEKLKVPVEKDAAIVLNVTEVKGESDISDDEMSEAEPPAKVSFKMDKPVKCDVCGVRHKGTCTNGEAWKRFYKEKQESLDQELAKKLKELARIGKKKKTANGARRIGTVRVQVDGAVSDED
jgi:hypothetical protein